MFTRAIVRRPCKSIINGLSTANLGPPDYENALQQHLDYIKALRGCGLEVTILAADEAYPDSTFVEDAAVVTDKFAIITNPGAPSRRGEEKSVAEVLSHFYDQLEYIQDPGRLEGGDVLQVGDHFFIGISGRTNEQGADQFGRIVRKYGLGCSIIRLEKFLHLKTGVAWLGDQNLLVSGELADSPQLKPFNRINVDEAESYASNCLLINGKVLLPAGFPKTRQQLQSAGYEIITVDVSEFRKVDGGLSCLSLRF